MQRSLSSIRLDDYHDSVTMMFEVCWEVARKMGGIYTVVRSKTAATTELYGNRYIIICPYNDKDQMTEFEFLEPKPDWLKQTLSTLNTKYGVETKFGKWLVTGYPYVIFLNLESSRNRLSEIKNELNPYLPDDPEANDAIIFGGQIAWLFAELTKEIANNAARFIVQFHEWMCGAGLVLMKKWNIKCATVFTTHATTLGRHLSAAKIDFYHTITNVDVDKEAGERGIYARHWIERAAAHATDCFTTVSEITAFEAKHLLGRQADVLLPNGLQVDKFEALHEFQNLHARYKAVINEFVRGHFYGHYDFNLENTLYFFTSGRYEVFNKGMDLYLDALAKLNALLKQQGSTVTVIAFIITNAGKKVNSFNVESLKGQSILRELHKEVDAIVQKMSSKIFEETIQGELISPSDLMTQEDVVRLKGRIASLKQRQSLPPVTTHNLIDDGNDEILNVIRKNQLFNRKEDRVKVIYHPEFLNSLNPLLPLEYNDFVRGCHLGVFPSYYEPWGYTPAECTVMGVPSVTSNLTGFANFMSRRIDEPEKHGLYVVDRQYKSYDDAVTQTANIMWRFSQLTRRQRIELRNKTEKLSSLLDWNTLNSYYENAHQFAIDKAYSTSPTTATHHNKGSTNHNTIPSSTTKQHLKVQL